MHFLDGVLSQNVAHIDDLFFKKDAHVALGILSSCVGHQFPYPTWTLTLLLPSCFFWQVSIRELCKYVGTLWV